MGRGSPGSSRARGDAVDAQVAVEALLAQFRQFAGLVDVAAGVLHEGLEIAELGVLFVGVEGRDGEFARCGGRFGRGRP